MFVCMYVDLYVCMFVCMYACMFVCEFLCLYVCMYVCMFFCLFVCMFYVCMHWQYRKKSLLKKTEKTDFAENVAFFVSIWSLGRFANSMVPLGLLVLLLSFFFVLHLFIVSLTWVGTQTS